MFRIVGVVQQLRERYAVRGVEPDHAHTQWRGGILGLNSGEQKQQNKKGETFHFWPRWVEGGNADSQTCLRIREEPTSWLAITRIPIVTTVIS
jgi:hypothetical protein